jgi:hypothetical protein
LLSRNFYDDAACKPSFGCQRLQPRLVLEVKIGGNERKGMESRNKICKDIWTEIEVVISETRDVVADVFHSDCFIKGNFICQACIELRPGKDIVAGG